MGVDVKEVTPVEFERTEDEANELADGAFEQDLVGAAPSLLSASSIVKYVEKTAMINPFYADKNTLKHASYEAKLGNIAYTYDNTGKMRLKTTGDGFLRIKANSIVFVQSAVTFRLPRYIAARFNLQIKHVHRGLLLGTGPLVDPGFHGRLLIPLHNLTSEDYYIREDEGFIWIEFTRTTFGSPDDEPYGDYPDRKKISDGARWLDKAALCEHKQRSINIQSSIPGMVDAANTRSEKAANDSNDAKEAAEKARDTLGQIGLWGAVATVVAVLGLWAAFYFGVRSDINALSGQLNLPSDQAGHLAAEADEFSAREIELESVILALSRLQEEIVKLKSELSSIEPSRQSSEITSSADDHVESPEPSDDIASAE